MSVPDTVRLFHIIANSNLQAIFESGALLAKAMGSTLGINYAHAGA
jgi:hypothetical protein